MSAKIAKALHDVMSKCSYVQKTGYNKFHNYKYASEADLLDCLRPAMIEAGLMLIPSVTQVGDTDEHGNVNIRVEYTLIHKEGEVWPEKIIAAGCGNDKSNKGGIGDKGLYKAITGANKYLLFKLFQIETGDDPERDAPEAPTQRKAGAGGIAESAPETAPEENPFSEADEQAALKYIELALGAIKISRDGAALRAWWNEERAQRQKYRLSQTQVDIIKGKLMERLADLDNPALLGARDGS